MKTITIKIVLAVLLLFCLLDMPYGYYELVRYLAMIGFAILAYSSFKRNLQTEMFFHAALAILYQPFFRFSLGDWWLKMDLIVAIVLLISIIVDRGKKLR